MIGKMHPPTPAPPNEQEIARPSRLLNQCVITMFPMLKNTPVATCEHGQVLELSSTEAMRREVSLTPMPTPWHRTKCQYSVHSAVRKTQATNSADAANIGSLRCPMSNNLP